MFRTKIALAATAALALVPLAAEARPGREQPAPIATVSKYAAINYDLTHEPENILLLDLSNGQRVAIRLMPSWAPEHVARVKQLASSGFYDGIIFHRVIEGFMAQTGDPTGTGTGGSQLPDLKAEFNPMPHVRGTVSMARAASEDSANSQFFITFMPRFSLDRKYTNFGRVIAGMAAVDAINRGEPPQNPTRIMQASLASEGKPPVVMPRVEAVGSISADELNAPIAN